MHIEPKIGYGPRHRRKAASAGPPAFKPDDLSGLALWLDASDPASITSSMGAVSQWRDKSGNNRHAVQGTGASQPMTGASSLNGLNTLLLDGSNDYLEYDGSIFINTNYTFFYVHRVSNFSNNYVLGGSVRTANKNLSLRYNGSTEMVFGQFTNDILATVAAMSAVHGRILSGRLSSTGRHFFWNGGSVGPMGTSAQLTDYVGASIGRFRAASGFVYSGQEAGEYIVYNRDLSDAEMTQVHAYLTSKWGIV